VNLNNITRPLDSSDLARAITQSEYFLQAFRREQAVALETNLLWTATCNRTAIARVHAVRS
jgi:hypothetical protein